MLKYRSQSAPINRTLDKKFLIKNGFAYPALIERTKVYEPSRSASPRDRPLPDHPYSGRANLFM
jgi:hypothetical protein